MLAELGRLYRFYSQRLGEAIIRAGGNIDNAQHLEIGSKTVGEVGLDAARGGADVARNAATGLKILRQAPRLNELY